MKKIILLFFALFTTLIFAQEEGIKFEKDTFNNILAKAKKENKLVFLDAYASWCGPCKLLDRNVFPKKEVGDFYNANFYNLHIDMEKGEGVEIAKKYGIHSYPTLLFINGNGEIVLKAAGYMPVSDFLKIGNEAINPENKLENKMAKFNAGESNPEFLMGLIKNTYSSDFPFAQKVATRYFQNKKEKEYTKEEAGMLLFFIKSTEDELFKTLIAQKAQVTTQIPESFLVEFEKQLKLNTVLQKSFDNVSQTLNDSVFLAEATKVYGENETQKLLHKIKMDLAFSQQKYDDYAKAAINYFKVATDVSTDELNNVAWNFYLYISDKNLLQEATKFCLERIKKQENSQNTDTLANIYYKLGDYKNAETWAKKSIELAKAKGDDYASTEELLKKIK